MTDIQILSHFVTAPLQKELQKNLSDYGEIFIFYKDIYLSVPVERNISLLADSATEI
jgi:hypothetical protein